METAARYKLPVITVLWNNSSWGPNFDQMPGLKGRTDPFNMLPNIRYDKIFAEMGCHGEQVETNEELMVGGVGEVPPPYVRGQVMEKGHRG